MDTTRFVKRVRIKCLPEEAFERWATMKGLESWFLTKAGFGSGDRAEAGAAFELQWAEGTTDRGEIVIVDPPRIFEFTWYDGQGRVRVEFSPIESGTLIELTHIVGSTGEAQMLEFLDCRDGWTFYLTNLKSVLEVGHDLRESQVDLEGLVNA